MAFTRTNNGSGIPANSEYRNLDLLRTIAVLSVLLAHLTLFLTKSGNYPVAHQEIWDVLFNLLGHLGVLFFFVHTALVLMLSLDRTNSEGLVVNFYMRRIFRIYPLSIVCIFSVLVLGVPKIPEGTYMHWSSGEILSNVLLVQNIFHQPDLITPLWTLPREVQMYVALPFIYLLLKHVPSSVMVLLLWLGCFAAVPSTPILSCFPCFMGGVFAYQLRKELTGKKAYRLPSAVWPVAILALATLNFVLNLTILPDYRADFVLCMLLGLVIPNVVDLEESWITRASRNVARYSYGIYLFHFAVIWFAFVELKAFPIPVRWGALVLLMIFVPWAAYRWIEAPLVDTGRHLADRWTVFSMRRRAVRNGLELHSAK